MNVGLLMPGERLVAELECCSCGWSAVCFCSENWTGPMPVPKLCPECGAPLARLIAPPSKGQVMPDQ